MKFHEVCLGVDRDLEATGTEELSNKVQAALMEAPEVLSTLDEHLDLI